MVEGSCVTGKCILEECVLSLDLPLWLFCFQLPWGEQLYSGTPSLSTTVFCFNTSPQRWGICGWKPETMSPKKSFSQVFCHSNEKWLSLHLVLEINGSHHYWLYPDGNQCPGAQAVIVSELGIGAANETQLYPLYYEEGMKSWSHGLN